MAVPIAAAAGAAAKAVAKRLATKAVKGAVKNRMSGGGGDDNRWLKITAIVVAMVLILGIAVGSSVVQGVLMFMPKSNPNENECYILPETADGLLAEDESSYVQAHGPNTAGSGSSGGGGGGGRGSRGGTYAFLPADQVPEHTGPLVFPVERLPGFYRSAGMEQRDGYYHGGYDWAGMGAGKAAVYAVADGVVLLTQTTRGSGNEVYTQHRINGRNFVTRNVHLHHPPTHFVKEGDIIRAGQQIGVVGNTGSNSTGPHLHFEVWEDRLNNYVNPDVFLNLNGNYSQVGSPLPGSPLDDGFVPGVPAGGSGAVELCYSNGGNYESTPLGGSSFLDMYPNGRIPAAALCSPAFAPNHKLDCSSVPSLESLNNDFRAAFGKDIAITDSYRSYEEQVRCRQKKGSLCATPGTSNHGFGRAIDLASNINNFGTAEHNWMRRNAPKYGWVLPEWAQENGSKPEPWHWEFIGFNGTSDKSPEAAKTYAQFKMVEYGWSNPAEFQCLNNLWERESNWNYQAENPSSGAYGIPQSLPGNKMASAGSDWRTNPQTQINWGLRYISDRYGTPCAAWDHSERKNWY